MSSNKLIDDDIVKSLLSRKQESLYWQTTFKMMRDPFVYYIKRAFSRSNLNDSQFIDLFVEAFTMVKRSLVEGTKLNTFNPLLFQQLLAVGIQIIEKKYHGSKPYKQCYK